MAQVNYTVSKDIEITHEADVVVIGGGPGGLGAAVMAARAGAKVLLVERFGVLGGMAAIGEVHPFMTNHFESSKTFDRPVYTDWGKKMTRYLRQEERADFDGEMTKYNSKMINKEAAALAAEELCLDAGVQILYHHTLCDVIMAQAAEGEGRKIDCLVLHSKSGYTAVNGKMYIDCSGDADLAAMSGCEIEFGGESGFCQPMTLCFKMANVRVSDFGSREDFWNSGIRQTCTEVFRKAREEGRTTNPRENVLIFPWFEDDVVHFNTTRVIKKSAINGTELSEAEIEAHQQVRDLLDILREGVPAFKDAYVQSMACHIGIRESRRVVGIQYVDLKNFEERTKFPDAIARINYPIDIHNPTGTGTDLRHIDNTEWYEIPFGSVVPKGSANLLVGGRPISVDHAVHSSMRVMPPACTVGQAAGMGAAMAAAKGVCPAELDGVEVRNALREKGANI